MPFLKQEIGSYQKNIMYIPLIILFIDLFVSKFLDGLFDKNAKIRSYFPYIKGAIIGPILAFCANYYWKFNIIINIHNIFYYYLSFLLLFSIIYGVILPYILKNTCN